MKICFFGHPAHEWSGSSRFFERLIEKIGDVTYLRPNSVTVDYYLRWALEAEFDLYIFFQFDFLAYSFLAAQKNVVIVPMIDGSASYGSEHWKRLKKGKFISFSHTLHTFLRVQGINSFEIQYWPKPQEYKEPKLNAIYYWPRGHHAHISVQRILEATKYYPELKIRVRATEETASNLDYSRVRSDRLTIVNVNDRYEHFAQIKEAFVFVAPRASEGIGHSFLEAMALGRAVLARKFPTMSNYISNEESGVFFPKNQKPIKPGLDWIEIGKQAHVEVLKGNERYLSNLESLQNYLLTPRATPKKFKVQEVHRLLDISCQIMRSQYFPRGKHLTLQNFSNATSIFSS